MNVLGPKLVKGYCRLCGHYCTFSSVIETIKGKLDGECFECYKRPYLGPYYIGPGRGNVPSK